MLVNWYFMIKPRIRLVSTWGTTLDKEIADSVTFRLEKGIRKYCGDRKIVLRAHTLSIQMAMFAVKYWKMLKWHSIRVEINICRNQTQKKLSFECFSIVLKYKLISHLYTFRHFVNCLKLLPVYSAIIQSWVVSSGNFCPTFLAFRVSP